MSILMPHFSCQPLPSPSPNMGKAMLSSSSLKASQTQLSILLLLWGSCVVILQPFVAIFTCLQGMHWTLWWMQSGITLQSDLWAIWPHMALLQASFKARRDWDKGTLFSPTCLWLLWRPLVDCSWKLGMMVLFQDSRLGEDLLYFIELLSVYRSILFFVHHPKNC